MEIALLVVAYIAVGAMFTGGLSAYFYWDTEDTVMIGGMIVLFWPIMVAAAAVAAVAYLPFRLVYNYIADDER